MIATLLAAATVPLGAEPARAQTWTLERVLESARQADPGVRAIRAGGRAARSEGGARAWAFSPQVRLAAGLTRSDDPALLFSQKLQQGRFAAPDFAIDELNQPAPRTALDWHVILDQPLWNSGAEFTSVSLSGHARNSAAAVESTALSERLLHAVEAYGEAVRARNALGADSLALGAAVELRRAAVELHRMGQVPELDTLRAVTRESQARAAWRSSSHDLDVALRRLADVVGSPVAPEALADPQPGSDRPPAPSPESPSETWQVRAARENADALGVEARRAAYRRLPSLNGRASLDFYRDFDGDTFERRFTAGLAVDLPVWDGGLIDRERSAAAARADEARYRAETLRRDLQSDLAAAWGRTGLARERRDTARSGRAAAEEALRLAAQRYRAGLLPLGDLLSADAEAAAARHAEIESEVDVLLSDYRYRHVKGDLQ
jgi:outer membrane protein